MKTGTMVILAAVLGGGGYFGWQLWLKGEALVRLRSSGQYRAVNYGGMSKAARLADDLDTAGFPLLASAVRQYGDMDDVPSANQTPALLAEYGRAEDAGVSLE